MTGLYIHVPFCKSKCPYCDFYSLTDIGLSERYFERVERVLNDYPDLKFDSVYFGGGTPSLVGAKPLCKLLSVLQGRIDCDAEITVECNPSAIAEDFFDEIAQCGVNRISLGMQSAVDTERRALGRLSGRREVQKALQCAQKAGIDNCSLDLMLGVPYQTEESLNESLSFCVSSGVTHISAYLLKLEEGTVFFKRRTSLPLPDEDTVCDMYLSTVEYLASNGFMQYEISNFALPGKQGRHNLNYWDCGEYLGIGPAAHSFLNGRRFYYPSNIHSFMDGCDMVDDGAGGDYEEYVMLQLRLTRGLQNESVMARYGKPIARSYWKCAEKFRKLGYVTDEKDRIAFTPRGFLLSNVLIGEIIAGE